MMLRDRRQNPYPWSWELPVGVVCAVLVVCVLGVHLGNGLAHLTSGHGWVWPDHSQLFLSVPAVLGASTPLGLPLVHAWVVVVELALAVGLGWASIMCWQRWGPSRVKGVATREQAERILGRTRLRKAARIIRPDLHRNRDHKTGARR